MDGLIQLWLKQKADLIYIEYPMYVVKDHKLIKILNGDIKMKINIRYNNFDTIIRNALTY